jgi:hypothetical protein
MRDRLSGKIRVRPVVLIFGGLQGLKEQEKEI